MAYLNKAMLIGNIGKDPTTAITNTGKKSVRFSLATSKRYRDANGEQKELTTWHNIVLWGATAETFGKLGVKKCTSLYIEGEIGNRTWTDNNGQQRSMTEVNASTFQLLTPRQNGTTSTQGGVYGQNAGFDYANGTNTQQAYESVEDDDLPF